MRCSLRLFVPAMVVFLWLAVDFDSASHAAAAADAIDAQGWRRPAFDPGEPPGAPVPRGLRSAPAGPPWERGSPPRARLRNP